MKIAIAGSGALGCGFGYLMKQGGNDVTLMDYWDDHIQAVQENGLTVDVNGETGNVKLPMDKPENIEDTFDVVFVFTKAMGLESMLQAIKHTLDENTKVVCLLNGLGHAQTLAEYVPEENIIMGTTVWTAGIDKPGVTHLMGQGPVEIQESHPNGKEATLEIVEMMQNVGLNGVYSDDVHFTTWRKACVNGTMNALSALLDANIQEVFDSSQSQTLITKIITEFSRAAAIENVELDVEEMVTYVTDISETVGAHYPSMHQDIANRRLTEIDFLNGKVAQMGEEHGFDAPNCALITDLIHAKEDVLGIK